MITNEERKKIAKRLRNFRWDVFAKNDSDFRKELNRLIEIDYYDKRTGILCSHGATWERIASLIEPEPERTCRMEHREGTDCPFCSHCGTEMDAYTCEWTEPMEYSYPFCYACGAKVVE